MFRACPLMRTSRAFRYFRTCLGAASAVTLLFDNGDRVGGDALIGADGVHSGIRREMFGEGRGMFTGFMAWRAGVPIERVLRQPIFTAWMRPTGQIVTYPLRQGTLLNVAATVRRDDWLTESWSEAGTVEECRTDCVNWHEDVLARDWPVPAKHELVWPTEKHSRPLRWFIASFEHTPLVGFLSEYVTPHAAQCHPTACRC